MPNELIFSKSKEVSTDSPLGTVSVRRYRQIRVLAMCSPLSPSSSVIQLAFNQGLGGIPGLALLLFLWVGSGALRRVRGRSSQVKGACSVAARGRCAPPWTCEPLRPLRAVACGQARGPARSDAQRPRTSAARVAAGDDRGVGG
jgi:hypothetical protein